MLSVTARITYHYFVLMHLIGLNSGTSADAIDAVLCQFPNEYDNFTSESIQILHAITHEIPEALHDKILSLRSSHAKTHSLREILLIQRDLSQLFCDAVRVLVTEWHEKNGGMEDTLSEAFHKIRAIGLHGQTIWHEPEEHVTWQLCDPECLAKVLGVDVVWDFRRADVALGGQGAPLTVIQDICMFGDEQMRRRYLRDVEDEQSSTSTSQTTSNSLLFSQNIGGIANMTSFHNGKLLMCYDQGPGNCLMDILVQTHFGQHMDVDGQIAKSGQVNMLLLNRLLGMEYFSRALPKSTGIELFGSDLVNEYVRLCEKESIPLRDLMRTFCELTVRSIGDSYLDVVRGQVGRDSSAPLIRVVLQGGGSHNSFLVNRLKEYLHENSPWQWNVEVSPEVDCKEAILFTLLAYLNVQGVCGNVPEVTGAKRRCILGSVSSGR